MPPARSPSVPLRLCNTSDQVGPEQCCSYARQLSETKAPLAHHLAGHLRKCCPVLYRGSEQLVCGANSQPRCCCAKQLDRNNTFRRLRIGGDNGPRMEPKAI